MSPKKKKGAGAKTSKSRHTKKRIISSSSEDSGSDFDDFDKTQSTTKVTTPAAKKRILSQSSGEEDFSHEKSRKPVPSNQSVRPQSMKHVDPKEDADNDSSDDVDTLVQKGLEKLSEEKAATLQAEERDKWFGEISVGEEFLETPKPPKRESKRPKHLEVYHVSTQKKNKTKKGRSNDLGM